MNSILEALERMEAQKTIGNMYEWSSFKKQVTEMARTVHGIRVYKKRLTYKVKTLERELENVKTNRNERDNKKAPRVK